MDREETKEVIQLIDATYPNFRLPDKLELRKMVDTWASLFSEEPFELVSAGLKAFIVADAKGFPPSPGQIKEKIRMIMSLEERTELEAWDLTRKAIANGRGDFHEAWEKLPMEIRQIVSPGQLREWSVTDLSQQQVVASNFMRSYRAKVKGRQEYERLPNEIKRAITGTIHQLAAE